MLKNIVKILSILLFLTLNILGTGFVSGTLVKTPTGYTSIENLKVGDLVFSYDFKSKAIIANAITKVHKSESSTNKIKKIVQVSVGENSIYVGENNRFYCFANNKLFWIQVKKLSNDSLLFKQAKEFVKLDSINHLNIEETDLYDLTVEGVHNFFVSKDDILVHNEPFTISLGMFLGYEVTINLAGVVIGVAGGLANKYIFKSDKEKYRINTPSKNDWHHYIQPHHNFNGKDPKSVYNCAELFVLSLMEKDEIKEGVMQYYTTFEDRMLKITICAINKLIYISNMRFPD